MKKKFLCITVCLLFVFLICDTSWIVAEKSSVYDPGRGITRYVGGISPGNYSRIQDAINASSDGDTVFVYDDSSPYYENIEIFRSISLIGEEKNTTLIHGVNGEDVIHVIAGWVTINGFTIGDGGNGICVESDYNVIDANIIKWNRNGGVFLCDGSDNNIIRGNIISFNEYGISLSKTKNNNIISNFIFKNYGYGIDDSRSYNNNIIDNIIKSNCYDGIALQRNNGGIIKGNTIYGNDFGIWLYECDYYTIMNNTIANTSSYWGLYLMGSSEHNVITNNTLLNNDIIIDGFDEFSFNNIISSNIISNASLSLRKTKDNSIINNSFFNGDIRLDDTSYQNLFYNNIVNGKTLFILINESDTIVNFEVGKIILIKCYNITVQNQVISTSIDLIETHNCLIINNIICTNKTWGIHFDKSTNNTIKDNEISKNTCGIDFWSSNNNTISNNIISNNHIGFYMTDSHSNTIMGNNVNSNKNDGICMYSSSDNDIIGNTANSNNDYGIRFISSNNNTVIDNNASNNDFGGIKLLYSYNNTITSNIISTNSLGISLNSGNNIISRNNFIDNKRHALFDNCINIWNQNYWGKPRILPKLIFGTIEKNSKVVPWLNIDWRPALKPYDLS